MPSDTPTLAPYRPDWCASVQEALNLRPELIIAREGLKASQLDVINSKNLLLPDLRMTSTYDVNAIGGRLDGPDPNTNAFRALAQNRFNDWSAGLRLVVPLGFRQAHSNCAARLALAQSYALLKDQEIKAEQYLTQQWRRLAEYHEQIRAQRAQRRGLRPATAAGVRRVGEQITADDTVILEAERSTPMPWPTSTTPSSSTTTCWPTSSTPRAPSCSTTTSSSPRGRCPPVPRNVPSRPRQAQCTPWCWPSRSCRSTARIARTRSTCRICRTTRRWRCRRCSRRSNAADERPLGRVADAAPAPAGQLPSTGPFTPATSGGGPLPRTIPSGNGPMDQGTVVPPTTPAGAGAVVPRGAMSGQPGQMGQSGSTQWTAQSVPPTPPTTSLAGATVPPVRPERFGASTMLPPSPVTRDSTPSLQSDALGTATGPSLP